MSNFFTSRRKRHRFFKKLREDATNIRQVASVALFPLSVTLVFLFWGVVVVRNLLYSNKLLPIHKLPVRVISVGNISVGGTGKTPFSEYLLRRLLELGLRPAYLSRGYGRHTKGALEVDSTEHNAYHVGDEALQVARKFRQVPVMVAENRVQGGKRLLQNHPELDVIVLDDAFQHRKVYRNYDIAMVDANQLPQKTTMLPLGSLREPFRALKRADLIVLNKIKDKKQIKRLQGRFWNKSVYCSVVSKRLIPFFPDKYPELKTDEIHKTMVVAFSGLARNNAFLDTLSDLYLLVYKYFPFEDHYRFRKSDLERIIKSYKKMMRQSMKITSDPLILTTEKDYNRLMHDPRIMESDLELDSYPFYYVDIELEFLQGADKFDRRISRLFRRQLKASGRYPNSEADAQHEDWDPVDEAQD